MKLSQGFWQTYKDAPADAEIPSHILMMRAGLIHKSGSGLYNYLPMGLRSIHKVEQIVREEHDKAGFYELTMSVVTPGELWQETDRWNKMGDLMLKFKDKRDSDLCISPTNEEAVTDIFRKTVKSYKQLPVSLYQINTKFRDEIRPRYGLMRGREFIMKDAYSFSIDKECLDKVYDKFYDVYSNIFTRMNLEFIPVEADAGAIGSSDSKTHEFQVIANSGEDDIIYSETGSYAANIEKAITKRANIEFLKTDAALEKVDTVGKKTIKDVCELLGAPEHQSLKAILYTVIKGEEQTHVALFTLGDDNLNEIKLTNYFAADHVVATKEEVLKSLGVTAGYVGPVESKLKVIYDKAIDLDAAYVVGANEADKHFKNFIPSRDSKDYEVADLRLAKAGDIAENGETVTVKKGIEVGHIFQLGDMYSKKMNTKVTDNNGREVHPLMGCYGIGVTRTVAAAIEQNHDENGIIWPAAIAPYHVYFGVIGKSQETKDLGAEIYDELNAQGIETLLDDRGVGPGFMFKDSDLIGLPVRVVLGERDYKKDGMFEIKVRRTGESFKVTREELAPKIKELLKDL